MVRGRQLVTVLHRNVHIVTNIPVKFNTANRILKPPPDAAAACRGAADVGVLDWVAEM